MTQNTTNLTPVEIDTILSENYNQQIKIWAHLASEVKHHDYLKQRFAKGHDALRSDIEKSYARIEELRAERSTLIAESAPYENEYAARRWHRYFLVTNGNGHVHRNMGCPTCFATTQYAWLVDLADCDEDAMIEEWGERACTVCFPSAPTNPLYNRPAKVDRVERERREAEKAAKAAQAAEKAITDVDGSPLRVDGDTLRTKVAARNALSSAFQSLVWYGDHPSDFEGQIRTLVPALNAAGVDWLPVAERAIKKVRKEAGAPTPYVTLLTSDQIAAQQKEYDANAKRALALLEEVRAV